LKSQSQQSAAATDARSGLARVAATWIKLSLAIAFVAVAYELRGTPGSPDRLFLFQHDLPVLVVGAVVLLAAAWRPDLGRSLDVTRFVTRRAAMGAAALAVFAGVVGVGLVFEHYGLSLDEFLADFDASIFRHGLLMAPVPVEWRGYIGALQPIYVVDTPGHQFWVSGYLPVNAMLRAAFGALRISDWLNPLLTGVAILATFGVGRQLWPEHPRRSVAAALLLATSAQAVIMGMSAYAMPAHLALNMVWLWLFLQRKVLADATAVAVGAAACGLHQVIFHPLFAGPFILELWLARRWTRAAVFTAAYAAIGLFWISYRSLLFSGVDVAPEQAAAVGGSGIVQQALGFLSRFKMDNVGLMAESLAHFVSWQNLLVPPLAIIGGVAVMRTAGPLRAMALGIVICSVAMLLLVPSQTHGWGYRYLHGFLGAAALLAVHGWSVISAQLPAAEGAKATRTLAIVGLISAVLLIPLHAWQARGFSHPMAASFAAIQNNGADVVLVDNFKVGFDMGSLVRNDPFLQAKPRVMMLALLKEPQLDELCRRGSVWVFDAENPAARGMLTYDASGWPATKRVARLRDHLRQIGCAD
jgi:hypothetical protein